ncbi:uncharacterized protein JCM15063_004016 [Sporobolomyces koalae]|uniref:uncharacterized protein n=1 Tax=Sporobolomyces koalae TaxID=500713 RepID=UPI0031809452
MAWTCSGSSNSELVANLVQNRILRTPRIIQAFDRVDRKYYVPITRGADPYADSPQTIGFGATISAPHMHAHAIENLEPFLQPGARVLDIGSGSAYLLSIMHQLVSPTGSVLGIDHLDRIVEQGLENLSRDPTTRAHLDIGVNSTERRPSITNIVADGRIGVPRTHLGSNDGKFSAIHVGAAAPEFPQALIDQLAKPGRMFVPVGPDRGEQHIWQIDKHRDGTVTRERLFAVRYIPLTDVDKQYRE